MALDTHAVQTFFQTLTDAPHDHALFIDIDGSLLERGATPAAVVVPDALPAVISGLSFYLGSAVVLLSGRTIADIDRLMTPVASAAAGIHGAQIRLNPDEVTRMNPDARNLQPALREALSRIASSVRGVLIADNPFRVALDFRNAPEEKDALRQAIEAAIDAQPDDGDGRPELLVGNIAFEVKSGVFDKGLAMDLFLGQPPYAGRRPIVVGDDTTDEVAFSRALELGGMAFSVGQSLPGAGAVFESPTQVREALEQVLAHALTQAQKA